MVSFVTRHCKSKCSKFVRQKRPCSMDWLVALCLVPPMLWNAKTISDGFRSVKDPSTSNRQHANSNPNSNLQPLDCSTIEFDDQPYWRFYDFHDERMVVDVAKWFPGGNNSASNITEEKLFNQIFDEVLPNELFVDVGANVGQMTMMGLLANKTTYAFDPLLFDTTKLCTGVKENVRRGWATEEVASKVHVFRSLVGNESKANVSISRPDDSFGRFEQASLFSNTIGVARKPKLVTEEVPMVRLDEIVPEDLPIGLVKIDVQGFELPVVQGMKGLLERETGFPHIIHYEEDRRVTQGAGFRMGTVQKFLESYGYTCAKYDKNNISCEKPRNPLK